MGTGASLWKHPQQNAQEADTAIDKHIPPRNTEHPAGVGDVSTPSLTDGESPIHTVLRASPRL